MFFIQVPLFLIFFLFFLSLLMDARWNFFYCPWWRVIWAANKRNRSSESCFDWGRKINRRTSLLDEKWWRKALASSDCDIELRTSAPLRNELHFLPLGTERKTTFPSWLRALCCLIELACQPAVNNCPASTAIKNIIVASLSTNI